MISSWPWISRAVDDHRALADMAGAVGHQSRAASRWPSALPGLSQTLPPSVPNVRMKTSSEAGARSPASSSFCVSSCAFCSAWAVRSLEL